MCHLLQKIVTALLTRALEFFPEHLPIVYKISLLITALIIFCSGTLSGILFYDQTRIMEEQINEFGNTMVTHLARSVQEPLLADDKLAMGVLVSSLMTSQSVIGTEILSPAGVSIVEAGLSPFTEEISTFMFSSAEIIAAADSKPPSIKRVMVFDGVCTNLRHAASLIKV